MITEDIARDILGCMHKLPWIVNCSLCVHISDHFPSLENLIPDHLTSKDQRRLPERYDLVQKWF